MFARSRPAALPRLLLSLPVLAVFAWVLLGSAPLPEAMFEPPAALPVDAGGGPRSTFVNDGVSDFVHASSTVLLPDGRLLAAWFSGSREGGPDVQIMGAYFDARIGRWSTDRVLTGPKQTQAGTARFVRKVGNPVLGMGCDGRLWLYYVSVSLGGWSVSHINAMYSDDLGGSWSSPRRLVTSPFINISTLVKGPPLRLADCSIALPVYHELAGKFGEVLRLDADGRVLDKTRMSAAANALQPVIVPSDARNALALLRNANDDASYLLQTRTSDAGRRWNPLRQLPVANGNAAVAALRLEGDSVIAVFNDTLDGRARLSLYRSDDDGASWRLQYRFEDREGLPDGRIGREAFQRLLAEEYRASTGDAAYLAKLGALLDAVNERMCRGDSCRFRYDYPYLTADADGRIHLTYTWHKAFIKHVSFDRAWLESLP